MTRAVCILLAVLLANLGYLSVDAQAQSWAFYVLRGVEEVVIGFALLGTFPPGQAAVIGTAAAWFAIWEGGETAVCGSLAWGSNANGLCTTAFGAMGYAGIIAIATIVAIRSIRRDPDVRNGGPDA